MGVVEKIEDEASRHLDDEVYAEIQGRDGSIFSYLLYPRTGDTGDLRYLNVKVILLPDQVDSERVIRLVGHYDFGKASNIDHYMNYPSNGFFRINDCEVPEFAFRNYHLEVTVSESSPPGEAVTNLCSLFPGLIRDLNLFYDLSLGFNNDPGFPRLASEGNSVSKGIVGRQSLQEVAGAKVPLVQYSVEIYQEIQSLDPQMLVRKLFDCDGGVKDPSLGFWEVFSIDYDPESLSGVEISMCVERNKREEFSLPFHDFFRESTGNTSEELELSFDEGH